VYRYKTVEEATEAKGHSGHVHVADPKWVQAAAAAGDGEREQGSRQTTTSSSSSPRLPPLMVAIDTSYDQDSQRAIRSVVKQLSECLGVTRKAAEKNVHMVGLYKFANPVDP
jgi:hypothetical protein